jgi:hypothetical protein
MDVLVKMNKFCSLYKKDCIGIFCSVTTNEESCSHVKDTEEIPEGMYCYTIIEAPNQNNNGEFKTKNCPYWSINENEQEQNNGYCKLLEIGDWQEDGMGLLWDQVKLCGIKDNIEDY